MPATGKPGLVCMDRDGTLIQEKNFLADPEQVFLYPGAGEAVADLHHHGFRVALITNQSGVGRGIIPEPVLLEIHDVLQQLLSEFDTTLDSIHYCPHKPDDGCDCRKPSPKMLLDAAANTGADTGNMYMIGDKAMDILSGKNAGAVTILVRTGYGKGTEEKGEVTADYTCDTLREAVDWILTR